MHCTECNCSIYSNVYSYSINKYGFPLCMNHQRWIDNHKATEEAIVLYLLLKERSVPAELEKYDGYKSVDIVIEEAKVHIEVDGGHHNYNSAQALADLRRTYYAFKKGYFTLRIPNSLIRNNPIKTTDEIIDILNIGVRRAAPIKNFIFKLFRT